MTSESDNFPQLKGLSILVTGGAGFIGSNLCEALLTSGARVRCLDNFATGHRHNIARLLDSPDFEMVEGDIRDAATCRQACNGVDLVLHQAALGSVPRSISDPATSNAVNIDGFLNMLIAAKDAGVHRFVYASSSSVYGDAPELPKVEERTGKPLSPYAITKHVNELYAGNFKEIYGLDTIGLRYFNVFGRRQDPKGAYAAVIPAFVRQLLNHAPVQINGDGSYSRDFTYIDNVVQMNLRALTTENPDAVNQVYNTAVGERLTIGELAKLLQKELARKDPEVREVTIEHGPARPGDVPHSLADISKAHNLLGYQPTHSVKEGLALAADWYFEHWRDKMQQP